MKARLVKEKNGAYLILCKDGTIAKADKENLNKFLTSFHLVDTFIGNKDNRWDIECPDMSMYPGDEYAMITDQYQLVLTDFTPFYGIYRVDPSEVDFISSYDYAKMVGKSWEQIKLHCRNGRIPGAVKIARNWMIPKDAPYPTDLRKTTRVKK